MTVGPLEVVVLGFDGNRFDGSIATAIADAIDTGAIRVVDLVFARKDADGTITVFELEDADPAYAAYFDGFADLRDLLTEADALAIAELLPANTSALLALIEHTWSIRIAEAVQAAGGALLASQRISKRLMEEVRDELEEVLAGASSR